MIKKDLSPENRAIVAKKYICIDLGDKETLHKKMEKVIYLFLDGKLIDASVSVTELYRKYRISQYKAMNNYRLNKLSKNGYSFLHGEKAVELVLSRGHGTAGDYKLE